MQPKTFEMFICEPSVLTIQAKSLQQPSIKLFCCVLSSVSLHLVKLGISRRGHFSKVKLQESRPYIVFIGSLGGCFAKGVLSKLHRARKYFKAEFDCVRHLDTEALRVKSMHTRR